MKNILLISAVFCTIIMSACNNNRNDSNTLKKQDKQTAVNPIAEKEHTIPHHTILSIAKRGT